MAASFSIDRAAFLDNLRASELFTAAQVEELARRPARSGSGRALAWALVQDGTLTRFQAERLLLGRTSGFLLGQYRILEQIGSGGMGRVYKAEHRTMKRVVALKVLAPELLRTQSAIDLFLREVRAAASLSHPNIVTAFDANEVAGRYYLVLEFVDGPNLDQLVRKQGPLSVGLACDYVRQAAAGLQCAHLFGMVHRDIKPANILVQRQGAGGDESPGLVKINDFGLARLGVRIGDGTADTILTKDNTVMGTPDYLSPEQARSLRLTDIRSDLYSLGCTFYYLLTGRPPFVGGTVIEKLLRHATDAPVALAELRDDVPERVQEIVYQLMAKAPEERFQAPAELAEALRPFAVSGPTPWAPGRSAAVLGVEGPMTPGELVAPGEEGDEAPALSNTVTGDPSPTPAAPALTESPSRLIRRRDVQARQRMQVAVGTAVAIVGAAVAVAALLGLLLR